MRIRTTMLALCLSLTALAAAPAFAAGTAAKKPMTAQQQKMADCSHQSKGMKGDAHKSFVSKCMKGDSTVAASTSAAAASTMPNSKMSQRDKMKACNGKAKGLKGSEHKSFMSTCLKG